MDCTPRYIADADRTSPQQSAGGEDEEPGQPDGLPACVSCRKRKSKCSRERPSCLQCTRLGFECQYVTKQKPGMKPGAVDGLSRRLEVLERILLDNAGRRKQHLAFLDLDMEQLNGQGFIQLLSTTTSTPQPSNHEASPLAQHVSPVQAAPEQTGPRKRKRVDEAETFCSVNDEDDGPGLPTLPSLPLLEAVVEAHFHTQHHWVPILHETRFRENLKDPEQRQRLAVLFHALLATAIKHVDLEGMGLSVADVDRRIRISRQAVVSSAMQSLTIENTQALVILASDYMNGGQAVKAWPIIGSLTRTVDYLQLTVEPDDNLHKVPLLRSLTILPKPQDWTHSEERRRLFWSVFLLDRICSVTSGWHTSLTSDDVRRRLPCGGGMWAREEPVSTPFFGIWDKSTAKIGNSIAHAPTMYPSPRTTLDHTSPGSASAGDVDTSKLGAFAYCIEATENLSQVTSFFLQQCVDFEDRQEVKDWLTRFKELDLRLVHWKKFLPQQWQDSNISRDTSIIKMDPNLTLAHISHNTSMILLHQHIAYPPSGWRDVVKLPSPCSAETCQLAAVETASIVQKYLQYMGGIVNSQFALCAFVAARVLLVHWGANDMRCNPLAPEFFGLVDSLLNMSTRWNGYCKRGGRSRGLDLAARYATQLGNLHAQCVGDVAFAATGLKEVLMDASLEGIQERHHAGVHTEYRSDDFNIRNGHGVQAAHFQGHTASSEASLTSPNNAAEPSGKGNSIQQLIQTRLSTAYERHGIRLPPQEPNSRAQRGTVTSPATTNMAGSNSNSSAPLGMYVNNPGAHVSHSVSEEDELTAMSHMLLGDQFLEMDRVITLDGTDFYYDAGGRTNLMS